MHVRHPEFQLAAILSQAFLVAVLVSSACPNLRAQTTGSVTVRVSIADNETPIDQAEVKLLSFGHMSASYWGLTDGGGHVDFHSVERGTYNIEVKKAGYDLGHDQVDVAPGLVYNIFVRLQPSQPRESGAKPPTGTVAARDAAVPPSAQKEFDAGANLFATDPKGSLGHFRKAIEIYPKYAEAWMLLSLVHLKLDQRVDALEDIAKAIEADPKFDKAYTVQGRLLLEGQQFEKAKAVLMESLKLAPQAWDAHFELARCYYNTGEIDKALEQARKARDAPQSNPVTHLLLADIYLKQNQKNQALAELEAYMQAEPASPMIARVQQKISQLRAEH